jgi:hypothetical protein
VYPRSPRPEPCTVTDEDPVAIAFAFRATLIDIASVLNGFVAVPATCPTVTVMRRVPLTPAGTKAIICVSDPHDLALHPRHGTAFALSQLVASLALWLKRIPGVFPTDAKSAPRIVIVADPVLGLFFRWYVALMDGLSIDAPPVKDPDCCPIVTLSDSERDRPGAVVLETPSEVRIKQVLRKVIMRRNSDVRAFLPMY